jgi:hypothetical protein
MYGLVVMLTIPTSTTMSLINNNNFPLTFELHDCLFHKLAQGGIWVEGIHILDQFANDFRISLRNEFET